MRQLRHLVEDDDMKQEIADIINEKVDIPKVPEEEEAKIFYDIVDAAQTIAIRLLEDL